MLVGMENQEGGKEGRYRRGESGVCAFCAVWGCVSHSLFLLFQLSYDENYHAPNATSAAVFEPKK
jgi:hypothetical protein